VEIITATIVIVGCGGGVVKHYLCNLKIACPWLKITIITLDYISARYA
jgi:hypothetical protein